MKSRLFFALALAGASVSQAFAADLPGRTPGLWQSTTTVMGADGQPLANAVNVVTLSCVDDQTDQKFLLSGASSCTTLTVSGESGSYTIDGVCSQQGQPVQIHEALVYADSKDVKLTAHLGTGTTAMTVNSQMVWQGDCMPGMLPGDEGNLVNGAFSKADNITDPSNQ
jgi:hypothetical protein